MLVKSLPRKVRIKSERSEFITAAACSDLIGVWLGVEWDDPHRGKHSGIHEGVEYFSCSVEGSGSFLRHKRAEQGCSFIQAVREVRSKCNGTYM